MNFRESPGRRRRVEASLELTSLIDVVFLLLIFFTITTTFARNRNQQANIGINLPKTVSGKHDATGKPVNLLVKADGTVQLNSKVHLTGKTIRAKLEDLYKVDAHANLRLEGDKNATHGDVMHLLDVIKQIGFTHVNLVTTQVNAGSGGAAD